MTAAASTPSSRFRAAAGLSGVLLVVAVLASDAAMVAVCGAARAIFELHLVQWLSAILVIAAGGFGLFGAPQVAALSRSAPPAASDSRTRWAVRPLRRGGPAAFVAAALTGGPLAVGWFLGRDRHPRAYPLTALSAVLMGGFWSAPYLSLVSLIF